MEGRERLRKIQMTGCREGVAGRRAGKFGVSASTTFMFVNFYAGYFVLPHVASVIGARILAMITSENITEIIDRKFVYK